MLSSIHPLGERARHNRWGVTVTAFTVGAVVSGGAVGVVLGAVGSVAVPLQASVLLAVTAVTAIATAFLDLVGVAVPGPKRQVNETWIGAFRGWVYGGGFGLELGLGFVTYIVTWGVYAVFVSALLTTSPLAGGLVGATFALGRSLSVLAAGFVDRPSRLTAFSRQLARLGPVVRKATPAALAAVVVVAFAGGLL